MTHRIILGLGAWLALGSGLSAQDTSLVEPDAPRVTLEEAIDEAMLRSPQLAQSETQVENAYIARRQNVGSFLPSLSSSSSMSVRPTSRFDPTLQQEITGSANSYSAGLSSSVNLFQGGQRFAELRASRMDIQAAEAQREDQRFAVELNTKQLFFSALEREELLEVARATLEQARQSLEITRSRFVGQEATASDTLRARLGVVNARQSVLTAEADLRAARFSLGRQVGRSEPVIPVASGGLDPAPLALTEEEMIRLAVEASPSVVASEASLQSARAAVSAAKSAWLPSLRASGNYNWSNDQFAFDGGRTSWGLSFSMSYPLFNGFSREGGIARADNAAQVARLQNEDARLAARQEVDAAIRSLETAERAIEIAREALLVAEEDLRITRIRYQESVAIILDVVTSQTALEQARVDLVTARFDYVIARAQLEAVLGRSL